MDDEVFLARYDANAFPAIAVAVDVVAVAVINGQLQIAAIRRTEAPQKAKLALIGTFVQQHETADEAAGRALASKADLSVAVRQFHTFSAVDRDPRMRIVTVGYSALLSSAAATAPSPLTFLAFDGGNLRGSNGRKVALAFDHDDIVGAAIANLQADLDTSLWSFGLLPEEFTLRELQIVHEAVRGRPLNKPAFRKRLLDSGKLIATGRLQTGSSFRPAELYKVRKDWTYGDS